MKEAKRTRLKAKEKAERLLQEKMARSERRLQAVEDRIARLQRRKKADMNEITVRRVEEERKKLQRLPPPLRVYVEKRAQISQIDVYLDIECGTETQCEIPTSTVLWVDMSS